GSAGARPPPSPPLPVAVLGVGSLGSALARALLAAGHPTAVWNRTPARTEPLVGAGAAAAPSPREVIRAAEVVVVAVADEAAVRAVLEPVASALTGRVVVALTSGTPEQARDLAAWVERHGARRLDGAAMSGVRLVGDPEALFLYAGRADAFAAAEPALRALGGATYLGPDPGVASLYDTALLGVNTSVLAGFSHGLALVGSAGVARPPSRPSPPATCRSRSGCCAATRPRSSSAGTRPTRARSRCSPRRWNTSSPRARGRASAPTSRTRCGRWWGAASTRGTGRPAWPASPRCSRPGRGWPGEREAGGRVRRPARGRRSGDARRPRHDDHGGPVRQAPVPGADRGVGARRRAAGRVARHVPHARESGAHRAQPARRDVLPGSDPGHGHARHRGRVGGRPGGEGRGGGASLPRQPGGRRLPPARPFWPAGLGGLDSHVLRLDPWRVRVLRGRDLAAGVPARIWRAEPGAAAG